MAVKIPVRTAGASSSNDRCGPLCRSPLANTLAARRPPWTGTDEHVENRLGEAGFRMRKSGSRSVMMPAIDFRKAEPILCNL